MNPGFRVSDRVLVHDDIVPRLDGKIGRIVGLEHDGLAEVRFEGEPEFWMYDYKELTRVGEDWE